jgi:hypothetical protein
MKPDDAACILVYEDELAGSEAVPRGSRPSPQRCNANSMRRCSSASPLRAAGACRKAQLREWLTHCNPVGRSIPTAAEIISQETRASATACLRLILSYGGGIKRGRKRPTGPRSRSFVPLLRVPAKIQASRPRHDADRQFIQNFGLTYLNSTGKRPPYKVDFQAPGPFSRFVHKCFELVGARTGHITKLINEMGRIKRADATLQPVGQ